MNRISHIGLFVAVFSWTCCLAQEKGGVSLHSDPRLALLISKTKAPDRAEEYLAPAAKRESRVKGGGDSYTPSQAASVKYVEYKAPKSRPAKSNNEEPKAPRRDFRTSTVDSRYSGNGFRVQIYNGTDRSDALRIKAEFMRNYPGVRTYLTYTSPHYRVKVGDFRHRDDAMGMFREASGTYSPCMIVPDKLGSK